MDNLNETKTFIAVADALSFAAGARKLGLSAAQASKLVARLEHRLGIRLLNRTTRDVSLTGAGSAYASRARHVVEDFEALETAIRDGAKGPRGTLKIAAPVSFASATLDGFLMDFAKSQPDLALEVSYSDRAVNLIEEGYDVAVRVGQLRDSSLVAKRLGETRILTCASAKYLASHPEPKKPAQLEGHACIIDLNTRDPGNWAYRVSQRNVTVRVEGRLRFSRAESCLRAARQGLGIARAPAFAALQELRSGGLKPLLKAFEPEPLPIHAVFPHSRYLPAKVRAFVDFLAPKLAKAAGNGTDRPVR